MVDRRSESFGGIRVDTTRWPIVLMEFPAQAIDDAHLVAALGRIEQLLRTGEKSFQITDLGKIREMAPASQRRLSADWSIRTSELQRAYSVGGCLVIGSALVRGLVTAVHWIKPPVQPTTIVPTLDEAYGVAERAMGLSNTDSASRGRAARG